MSIAAEMQNAIRSFRSLIDFDAPRGGQAYARSNARGTGPRTTMKRRSPHRRAGKPIRRHATLAGDRPPRYDKKNGSCYRRVSGFPSPSFAQPNARGGQALALRDIPPGPDGSLSRLRMHNHESTITSAFVDILRPMRATWKVHEEVCPYRSARLRPDVFITEERRKPIPIEIKIDDDDEGESQARKHLGQILGDAYDAALAENASQLKLFADEDAAYQTQASAVGSTSVPSPAAVGGGSKP